MKRCGLIAFLAAVSCFASAGTYAVDEIEFVSMAYADGGFIQREGDLKTLKYQFVKNLTAGPSQYLTANPFVASYLKWKVHWTGSPTEPVPSTVHAKVAIYGHSYTSANLALSYGITGQYEASSQLTDALSQLYSHVASTGGSFGLDAWQGTTTNAHLGYITLGASFTSTGPGTADGTVLYAVNGGCVMFSRFQPNSFYPGAATSTVDTVFRLRIIEIENQTVDTDLP